LDGGYAHDKNSLFYFSGFLLFFAALQQSSHPSDFG
jgi:hypothetical protein